MSGLSGKYVNVEVPRDGMGRPLVLPLQPDPKKPDKRSAYRRVTRFVGAIEDRYNLELHGQREVIWGMGARPDLVALAAAVPWHWQESGHGKRDMAGGKNSIADQARDAAQTAAKANTGTALHQFCELLDKDQLDWRRVPAEHKPSLEAYYRATREAGMRMVAIESFRVHDAWRVAGTTDRIVEINGRHYIADIKTGKIEFDGAVLKMAMQLAMYAHSVPYDPETDTRGKDAVPVDVTRGIIIHLPVSGDAKGECSLHWLDIQYGWAGCQECKRVWEIRDGGKVPNLMSPYTPVPETVTIPSTEEYIAKVLVANNVAELEYLWRSAHYFRRDSDDLVAACVARKAALQTGAVA